MSEQLQVKVWKNGERIIKENYNNVVDAVKAFIELAAYYRVKDSNSCKQYASEQNMPLELSSTDGTIRISLKSKRK